MDGVSGHGLEFSGRAVPLGGECVFHRKAVLSKPTVQSRRSSHRIAALVSLRVEERLEL